MSTARPALSAKRAAFTADLTLMQQGLLLVVVPLLFELALVGTLAYLIHQVEVQRQREALVTNFERVLQQIPENLGRAGDYLASGIVFKSDKMLDSFKKVKAGLPQQIAQLNQVLQDEPEVKNSVDPKGIEAIEREVNAAIALIEQIGTKQFAPHQEDQPMDIGGGVSLLGVIKLSGICEQISHQTYALVQQATSSIQTSPELQQRYRQRVWQAICAGAAVNTLLAIVLALQFSRGAARRIGSLLDNMEKLRKGKLLMRSLEGRDEIAQLDRALCEMCKSLELAAQRERASNATSVRIIETIPQALLIITSSGMIELANPAALRLFRCAAGQLQQKAISDVLPVTNESSGKFIQQLYENQNRLIQRETIRQDGEQLCINIFSTSIETNQGARLLLLLQDETERWRIEKLRQQLVSMISHDLRAPLTSVLGSLNLMSMGALGTISDTAKECVGRAEEEIGKLINLVHDLLDVAKIDAGRMPIRLASVKLDGLIKRSLASVRRLAESRSVTLEYSSADVRVIADSDRLVQVLVNLLSNAIKFSPPHARVVVSVEQTPAAVIVRVADQGPGIDQAQQKSIFERFSQSDGASSSDKKSSGLGLSICKSIMEQIGGSIGIDSDIGKGSTFWLRFPSTNEQLVPDANRQAVDNSSSKSAVSQMPSPWPSKQKSSLNLWQKGLVLVSVPLIFELTLVACLGYLLHQSEINLKRLDAARNYRRCIMGLVALSIDSGRSVAIYNMLENRRALQRYHQDVEAMRQLSDQLPRLREEGQFNPEVTSKFQSRIAEGIRYMDETVNHHRQQNVHPDGSSLRTLKVNLEGVLSAADQFDVSEQSVVEKSASQINQSIWLALWSGLAANTILAVTLAVYFSRGTAARLHSVVVSTKHFARGEELGPPLTGTDEIAQLDRFFRIVASDLKVAAEKERLINERIRLTVENLPAALFVIDQDGKIESANRAALRMFGGSEGSRISSRRLNEFVRSHQPEICTNVVDFAANMEEGQTIQLELSGENTKPFAAELSAVKIETFAGTRLMIIIADVSERRELERLKRELIDTVYNDLSTPLRSVHNELEQLSSGAYGKLPDEVQHMSNVASSEIERLRRLAQDLLDWAKIQTGTIALNMSAISFRTVLNQALSALKFSAEHKHICIDCLSPDLQLTADPDRLVQVLVNLLSNAIKFSPEGSTIKILVERSDGHIEVQICDRGRGVPASQHDAIFEEFHQVQATDATVRGGTGLGLPICRRIITAHGGTIGMRDNQERGSIFWFTLPLQSQTR